MKREEYDAAVRHVLKKNGDLNYVLALRAQVESDLGFELTLMEAAHYYDMEQSGELLGDTVSQYLKTFVESEHES